MSTEKLADRAGSPARSPNAVPAHVAIVGLGPSMAQFVSITRRLGGRHKLCDEVWAINALGDVLACDRIFHMDDVRIQEIRAAARPDSNIASMLEWMRVHPGPIYTSRTHPDYPGLVAFPLEDVFNSTGYVYFNSTAAYTIAYAIHIGVKRITIFGMDFTYPDAHDAEKGRACVEFWLGIAAARGIEITICRTSTLMDACEPFAKRAYGYDTVDLVFSAPDADGRKKISFVERAQLPTADQIESDYDHSKHPNSMVSAVQEPMQGASGLHSGERQVAPTKEGIRRDHVARYEWAAAHIPEFCGVVDVACGVGYGTRILAEAGHAALGLDCDDEAIAYAKQHYATEGPGYAHQRIAFRQFDAANPGSLSRCDAAVCFETVEHIEDPLPLLKALRSASRRLIASVPNESVFPYRNHAFHFRHYTREQFEALLHAAGWKVTGWFGQAGPESEVEPDIEGRTLIAACEHLEAA